MKPIEAIYRHGRLYDLNTQQSINLREEARVILIVDSSDDLNPKDPYIQSNPARPKEKVLEEVQRAGYFEYRKAFDRE